MKLSDKLAMSAGHGGVWLMGALHSVGAGDYVSGVLMGAIFVAMAALTVRFIRDIDEALKGREGGKSNG